MLEQFIYRNQKSKIIDFEIKESGDDFLIHLNKDLLMSEGRELITKFLITLQTYKSSGCVERGKKFYDEYSTVDDFFLKIREIVVSKKLPRRVELNNNLIYYNESCIEPQCYPEKFEGIIMSFRERYGASDAALDTMLAEWKKRSHLIRVGK